MPLKFWNLDRYHFPSVNNAKTHIDNDWWTLDYIIRLRASHIETSAASNSVTGKSSDFPCVSLEHIHNFFNILSVLNLSEFL